jgi:hypothetical protein
MRIARRGNVIHNFEPGAIRDGYFHSRTASILKRTNTAAVPAFFPAKLDS